MSYSYNSNTYELASISLNGVNLASYSYSQGRMTSISSPAGTFNYSYLQNSDLLSGISNPAFEVHRAYDAADRLTAVSNLNSTASVISSFGYTLDSTGRRIERTDADNSRLNYGYDSYDQLTSAAKTNSPNPASDASYQFAYQYDEVGNRKHEDRGLLDLDGTFNPLNQLTALKFAGKLDVVGQISGTNGPFTVKVDGENATVFNQTNFWGGGRVKTGTNTISIVSSDASTNRNETLRHVTFPPTNPQQFTWDANGNLTGDGTRNLSWDEENKLAKIEAIDSAQGVIKRKSEYLYDGQSRRIQKKDYSSWSNGVYQATNTIQFVYDGWNLIQEISSSGITNQYIWGQDLSGTLQGAGGIGGLLSVTRHSTLGTSTYYPCFDGNGNISDYVNTNGVVVAHREYDPFGNTVVSTGPMKDAFSFWFSTKYYEPWWNIYYYGYRFYSPSLHIFPSRDPIGDGFGIVTERPKSEIIPPSHTDIRQQLNETAILLLLRRGIDPLQIISSAKTNEAVNNVEHQSNLYLFCANNPVMFVDLYGLIEGPGPDDAICLTCIAGLWAGCAAGCIGSGDYRNCVRSCVYTSYGNFNWPNTYSGRRCACLCDPPQMEFPNDDN